MTTSVDQYWSKVSGEIYKSILTVIILWLCCSVDKCLAVNLVDPGSIPNQGDIFSLKFLLKMKWTKWWRRTRARTRTTTHIIPWSLADGRRQKYWLRKTIFGFRKLTSDPLFLILSNIIVIFFSHIIYPPNVLYFSLHWLSNRKVQKNSSWNIKEPFQVFFPKKLLLWARIFFCTKFSAIEVESEAFFRWPPIAPFCALVLNPYWRRIQLCTLCGSSLSRIFWSNSLAKTKKEFLFKEHFSISLCSYLVIIYSCLEGLRPRCQFILSNLTVVLLVYNKVRLARCELKLTNWRNLSFFSHGPSF